MATKLRENIQNKKMVAELQKQNAAAAQNKKEVCSHHKRVACIYRDWKTRQSSRQMCRRRSRLNRCHRCQNRPEEVHSQILLPNCSKISYTLIYSMLDATTLVKLLMVGF